MSGVDVLFEDVVDRESGNPYMRFPRRRFLKLR